MPSSPLPGSHPKSALCWVGTVPTLRPAPWAGRHSREKTQAQGRTPGPGSHQAFHEGHEFLPELLGRGDGSLCSVGVGGLPRVWEAVPTWPGIQCTSRLWLGTLPWLYSTDLLIERSLPAAPHALHTHILLPAAIADNTGETGSSFLIAPTIHPAPTARDLPLHKNDSSQPLPIPYKYT